MCSPSQRTTTSLCSSNVLPSQYEFHLGCYQMTAFVYSDTMSDIFRLSIRHSTLNQVHCKLTLQLIIQMIAVGQQQSRQLDIFLKKNVHADKLLSEQPLLFDISVIPPQNSWNRSWESLHFPHSLLTSVSEKLSLS